MPHSDRPAKATQGLLIQSVGHETLVYHERRHQAFCLDPLASAIWNHADGTRTPRQIASACTLHLNTPIAEQAVLLGLDQMQRDGLLEPTRPAPSNTLSRRSMIGKVGVGAAMMVPVIASVIAPSAAQAYSGCFNCTDARPSRRQPNPSSGR